MMANDREYDFVVVDGERRYLACHERTYEVGAIPLAGNRCVPVWGTSEKCPIIPRAAWVEQPSKAHLITRILDQDGLNYCHSYAGVQALMGARNAAGLLDVELSAVCLGSQVTSQRNAGAALSDVLPVLIENGTVPATLIPGREYNQRRWPAGWEEQAKEFTVIEAYDIGQSDVFEQAASALQRGFFVAFGMNWGRGGHALCAVDLVRVGGKWGWHGVGSWGPTAHDGNGWWTFAESELPGLAKYGCFAVRAAKRSKEQVTPPALR